MIRKSLLSGCFIFLAACGAPAAAPQNDEATGADSDTTITPSPLANQLITQGWREAVISVSDLEEWRAFFENVAGWEMRSEGAVSSELLEAWKLPEGASARYLLMANPGSTTGFVRIIDFDGVEQQRIRKHDQPWETGGVFNVDMRVSNMAELSRKATEAGWQAPSAPVEFSFGPYVVKEWIPRHKDGVRIAFIERVQPPLEGWPNLKTTSRAFNSTQIVADMDRAMAFYRDALGFKTYLETRGPSPAPGESVLGLSREATAAISRNVQILEPRGRNEGSVELLEFEGYSGRDFAASAVPPNLGVLMLRFPVEDIDRLASYFEEMDIPLEYAPVETTLAPYGAVRMLALRAPDGAWIEFFETLAPSSAE